ncbi:MAG: CsoS2 family carboxysome shell protein, partial [Elioraea sp.]|nr:CsoS2 family carboxysome shell protein [Elioraea sp.]
SRVRITGDEASATRRITGEADQTLEDDLSPRPTGYIPVSAQFQRQANPHGHSVFGTNLGRSIRHVGSRERTRQQAVEVTEGGAPITGTAVGRSVNVTGDEPGACRTLTGTQYLTPARRMEACSGPSRALHPMAGGAAARRDPVTGRKVHEIQTWGGQRVTGTDIVEHMDQVTGDEPGECRVVTGTPYLGPNTTYGFCEADVASAQEERLPRPARARVTGDVPMHEGERVTGTERGAERSVTGTPYWREETEEAKAELDPVARAASSFSIRTPAREAHLERRGAPRPGPRITGSFAVGEGKLTGNVEFGFVDRWSRKEPGAKEKVGHQRITGHGSVSGHRITGSAWDEHPRVTGTEGYFATVRNPTVAQGDPHGFAGARTFKRESPHKEPRRLVTGVIGWTPKSAAIVTLSGGAQG